MTGGKHVSTAPPPIVSDRILACLKAPGGSDGHGLELIEDGFRCPDTGKTYPFIGGVPSLYAPPEGEGEEVTSRVKSFYEEHPFPNYEGLEEFGELVSKGSQNAFSAKRVTGCALDSDHGNDVTCFRVVGVFAVIGMHAHHSADPEFFPGTGIGDLVTLVQASLVDSGVGQLAELLLGEFEGHGHRGLFRIAFQRQRFAGGKIGCLRRGGLDR